MKRPILFYFVAAWGCLEMLLRVGFLTRPLSSYQTTGTPVPPIWLILPLLGLAVVVWQTVGLLQLKRFNRWLAVAFFGWFAISSAWGATISFRLPTIKPAPAFLIFFFLIATNLLCAWYLSRHTFREFAVSFVARRDKEKNARMMEEIARKRIQNENRR